MGFYVCSENFKASSNYVIWLENSEVKTGCLWRVLDTDDLVTEVYTSAQIVKFYKQGVHFENIEEAYEVDTNKGSLRLKSIFPWNKVVEFPLAQAMFLRERSESYQIMHIMFHDMYYRLKIMGGGVFPDFRDNMLVIHDVSLEVDGILHLAMNLWIEREPDKLVAVPEYTNGSIVIAGEPCSRASFRTKVLLSS